MPKSKHTKKQKEAARDWAKTTEDAIFVLGKLSSDVADQTVSKIIENLYFETENSTELSRLAISFVKDEALRELCEKDLDKVIGERFIRLLENFPAIKDPETETIFSSSNSDRSLSGYRVTQNFLFDFAIYSLWDSTDQELDTFNSAISCLTKLQREFVSSRIEKCSGNFEFFNFERRSEILLSELGAKGYKIQKHDFFVYGWIIKRPSLLGKKFELAGYDDLEGFYRGEVGEPNYDSLI